MTPDGRPSRATPDGQVLAFVEGLTALTGRRRAAARIVCALVLVAGASAGAFGAAKAIAGAFG